MYGCMCGALHLENHQQKFFEMKSCQIASLAKYFNVEVFFISEFVISEIRINSPKMFEVILISEFMNPEIRITSTVHLGF